jgi:hypothetical protein
MGAGAHEPRFPRAGPARPTLSQGAPPVEITSDLWRLVREGALAEADARVAEQRAAELAAASRVVVDVDSVGRFRVTGSG